MLNLLLSACVMASLASVGYGQNTAPECNCQTIENPICLNWGREDIFYHFEGLCFADKIKLAIAYVRNKIAVITAKNAEIEGCLPAIREAIKTGQELFDQYNECYLAAYCTNVEHLRRLNLKLEQLQNELKREQDKKNLGFLGKFVSHFQTSPTSHIQKVW